MILSVAQVLVAVILQAVEPPAGGLEAREASAPVPSPAVVTHVRGLVTASEARGDGASGSSPWQLRPLQVVPMGAQIHLPPGSQLGIVCPVERWVVVPGAQVWKLTSQDCWRGEPLPPGTYRSLLPVGGRLRSVQGLLALERETRGSDGQGGGPVLVSPRNTAVLSARPEIRWLQRGSIGPYELVVEGPTPFAHRIPEDEIRCASEPSWPDEVVCRAAYPRGRPSLPPGRPVPLGLRRLGGGARLALPAGSATARYLGASESQEVQEAAARLASFPGEEAVRRLLLAEVLAERGVLTDAIDIYQRSVDLAPEVTVTLADLYQAIGLDLRAERLYLRIEETTHDRALRAASAYGLGRMAFREGKVSEGLDRLRRARTLYQEAGDEAAAASIEVAIEEAAARWVERD